MWKLLGEHLILELSLDEFRSLSLFSLSVDEQICCHFSPSLSYRRLDTWYLFCFSFILQYHDRLHFCYLYNFLHSKWFIAKYHRCNFHSKQHTHHLFSDIFTFTVYYLYFALAYTHSPSSYLFPYTVRLVCTSCKTMAVNENLSFRLSITHRLVKQQALSFHFKNWMYVVCVQLWCWDLLRYNVKRKVYISFSYIWSAMLYAIAATAATTE